MQFVSVVTGAAGGLGTAITAALIDAGCVVVGLDKDETGLEALSDRFTDREFEPHGIDLTNDEAIKDVFGRIASTHGCVNGLVNNAGTCLMGEFPEVAAAEVEAQIAINFQAAFNCCQAAIPLLLKADGCRRIVNISSNGAYNFDVFDPPHYRASKAALDTLTKDLARRYATDKIAVNSIAPAMTETPLFDVLDDRTLADAIARMPHGKPMQPAQIADWVAFLMSPAGDVCSGNIIVLNQGRDVR